jgi:hypothetical protein
MENCQLKIKNARDEGENCLLGQVDEKVLRLHAPVNTFGIQPAILHQSIHI